MDFSVAAGLLSPHTAQRPIHDLRVDRHNQVACGQPCSVSVFKNDDRRRQIGVDKVLGRRQFYTWCFSWTIGGFDLHKEFRQVICRSSGVSVARTGSRSSRKSQPSRSTRDFCALKPSGWHQPTNWSSPIVPTSRASIHRVPPQISSSGAGQLPRRRAYPSHHAKISSKHSPYPMENSDYQTIRVGCGCTLTHPHAA